MRLPFCDYHISILLKQFFQSKKPLDLILSQYFRAHKHLGSHDRKKIGETLYQMVRWKSLIDFFCRSSQPIDFLNCFKKICIKTSLNDKKIPEAARLGVNQFLYERLKAAFGEDQFRKICRILNTNAPTTIRVNLLKTTKSDLFKQLKSKFTISPCLQSPIGIQFAKREPLFNLKEFKEGLFEVQDEGSQLVSELVTPKPGDHFLDYCSGSGGKTLAIAPKMQGKGQIYLHDTRPWILLEAKKRLKRAGVQNVQFLLPKKQVDWLLIDVPCSGTGTLRRNPDAKWKIDKRMVKCLIFQQRQIVHSALKYLKPNGRLVYVTCSLLKEENEEQVNYFLEKISLTLEKKPLQLLPQEGGMDGFFAAVLKKQTCVTISSTCK